MCGGSKALLRLPEGSRVCAEPGIWVLDGLLSGELLRRVDEAFEHRASCERLDGKDVRLVQLGEEQLLPELLATLRELCHVEEVSPCPTAWVMEVQGCRPQKPHMDGWDMSRHPGAASCLDLSKLSVQRRGDFATVVPTLSFVVYFNDAGACRFPRANVTVPAKRGRILMFQNYLDAQRPRHNEAALHFGLYDDERPKRVMTCGLLSEETPGRLLGQVDAPRTRGLFYAPVMHNARASCPSDSPRGPLGGAYLRDDSPVMGIHFRPRTPSPPRRPPRTPSPEQRRVVTLSAKVAEELTEQGRRQLSVEATSLGGEALAGSPLVLGAEERLGALRTLLGLDKHAQLVVGDRVLVDGDDAKLCDTPLGACLEVAQGEVGQLLEP